MTFKNFNLSVTVTLAGLLTSLCAFSLPEDQYQAIDIEANQAFFDDKQGITIYSGDVIFTQGSLELRSEKITIKQNAQQALESILAESNEQTGQSNKVTMKQQILGKDGTKEWVNAEAKELVYLMKNKKLKLKGDAQIKKGQAIINSDLIIYDANKGVFKAKNKTPKTKPGEQTQPSSRVRITIPPQTQPAKEENDL